jgi:hypothetical protein
VPFSTLSARQIRLEPSDPNFRPRVAWALQLDGVEITRTCVGIDHRKRFIQLVVCSECGIEGCAPHGAVTIRRVGDVLVWMPPSSEGLDDRERSEYSEAPAVHEPAWFDVPRYREFLESINVEPDIAVPHIPALTRSESVWIMRSALTASLLGMREKPMAWDALDAARLYRSLNPITGHAANVLLETADRARREGRICEVRDDRPSVECEIEEAFDLPGHPIARPIVLSNDSAPDSVWCVVGRGCWGRLERDTSCE